MDVRLTRSSPFHSSHILKYKEWQDAEYIAEGIDVNIMRLPVNGVFAEREAMANVWITHKGM
jgi:DNA ligase-1